MKVRDLIKALKKCHPDSLVAYQECDPKSEPWVTMEVARVDQAFEKNAKGPALVVLHPGEMISSP